MFESIITAILAILAPALDPDKKPPSDVVEENGQHFCCTSVDHDKLTGDGCIAISPANETLNACNKVLFCDGAWTKDDGMVVCSQP